MTDSEHDGVYVGEPAADLGENRYLVHFTGEIIESEEVVGYILFTRYAYRQVREDRIPFKWLVQPHSYMSLVSNLLLRSDARYPDLPIEVEEVIADDHGHVYIIDEITCNQKGMSKRSHLAAISIAIEYLKERTDGILIADAEPFARYLSDMKKAPVEFWSQYGVKNVSNRFLYSKHLTDHVSEDLEFCFPDPF